MSLTKVTFTIDPAKTEDFVGVLPSKQYRGYPLEVPADEIYATLNGNEIDIIKTYKEFEKTLVEGLKTK